MARSPRSRQNPPQSSAKSVIPGLPQADTNQDIREKIEEIIPPMGERGLVIDRVVRVVESFSGPIAHPRHLAEYEAIFGLADRIMKMAEKAQDRLEDRKDKLIENEYKDRSRGMWLGFSALAILVISGSVISIFGSVYLGGGLITAAVAGAVISPFINGRSRGAPQQAPGRDKPPSAKS
jgi:uncharacterized membrane protein